MRRSRREGVASPGRRPRAGSRGSSPREVDHRRRRSREAGRGRARRRSRRGSARARRRGSTGSGPPGSFALVASDGADRVDDRAASPRQQRDADADRPGLAAGQPREAAARVRRRRACTGPGAARASTLGAAQLGDGLEQRVDARGERSPSAASARGPSARRAARPAPSSGARAEPVDACRSGAAPAGPRASMRGYRRLHRPSTTRSRPARSRVIVHVGVAGAASSVARRPRARVLVHLEHEPAVEHARGPISALRLAAVDERAPRLPVAHLRLERRELVREHVRRVRDDEVERARDARRAGPSRRARPRAESLGVLAGERERVRRDVGRGHARVGALVLRARARSRRCRCRRRRRAARRRPAISARQRSTTISVSGRGTSARASVFSVRRRKPQSPST